MGPLRGHTYICGILYDIKHISGNLNCLSSAPLHFCPFQHPFGSLSWSGGWSWKKSRPCFVSRALVFWVWWSRPPCSHRRTDCETNVHGATEHSEVCVYSRAHTPIGHGCVRRMATCHSLGRNGSGHLGLWDQRSASTSPTPSSVLTWRRH